MKPEYDSLGERANLAAGPTEQADESPLPGLSDAQTEFFYRLRDRAAKHELVLTVTRDGKMLARETNGQSHSWGSIHDEVCVAKLITVMIDATLGP
jgi:hypothetical protein